MSIEQPRQPSGTPTGGRFAATSRTEPALELTTAAPDPERDADTMLARSVQDAGRIAGRITQARARLAEARARQMTASAFPDRTEDHLFWTERAAAAEEDLADLRAAYDCTVPGLAALTVRHDQALADLREMGSGLHPVDPESYEATRQDLARVTGDLERAIDPDLTLVFGGDDLPEPMRGPWSGVGMVAAPVTEPGEAVATEWRVSFVDVRAGAELGRVTIPAEHARDRQAPDRLDKTTIAAHVTWLAEHSVVPAAEVVDQLPGPVKQAA